MCKIPLNSEFGGFSPLFNAFFCQIFLSISIIFFFSNSHISEWFNVFWCWQLLRVGFCKYFWWYENGNVPRKKNRLTDVRSRTESFDLAWKPLKVSLLSKWSIWRPYLAAYHEFLLTAFDWRYFFVGKKSIAVSRLRPKLVSHFICTKYY